MNTFYFLEANPTLLYVVTAFFSLFIGSFLNVVIYRLPKMLQQAWSEECEIYLGLNKESTPENFNLFLPLSHCPHCKRKIVPWHNVPLFSYLWLRGKCAACKGDISFRYPLVELLTAIASTIVIWHFGLTIQAAAGLIFTWVAICLTFIDIDHHLLPDELTLALLWCGLLFSIIHVFVFPEAAILGAVAGYITFAMIQWLFALFTGKRGMGQGDYKFLAAIGAFLGIEQLPLIILLASVSGVIFTFAIMLGKRSFKSEPLPFGPYLAIAAWLTLLWGPSILQQYLTFFRF